MPANELEESFNILYNWTFSARLTMIKRAIAKGCLSVCLSVCYPIYNRKSYTYAFSWYENH